MYVSPIRCGALAVALLIPACVYAQTVVFRSGFQSCDDFEAPLGAVLWDGGGDGEKWSDPLNWFDDQVPGNNASVALRGDSGNAVIYDNSAGTTSIGALASCLPLSIVSGSLTVNSQSTVTEKLTISGSGTFVVNATSNFRVVEQTGGNLRGIGFVFVANKYTWAGGDMWDSGTTVINGGLDITTNTHRLRNGRTLELNSPTLWTGGIIDIYSGPVINNNDVFDIKTDQDIRRLSGEGTFNNNNGATLKKTAGASDTGILINWLNNGDIMVDSGTLFMGRSSQGSNSSGDFTVANGATFGIIGDHSLSGTFTGGGGLLMPSGTGTTTLSGSYGLTGPLTVEGGVLIFNIPLAQQGNVSISAGDLVLNTAPSSFAGNLTLSGSGELQANTNLPIGGTVSHSGSSAYLRGTGTVTVTGKYTWAGGDMWDSGTTVINGGLDITTTTHRLRDGRTLELNSPTLWNGGIIDIYSGPVINNNDVFDIKTDQDIRRLSGEGTFNNNSGGTVKKTAGASLTSIGTAFVNDGTLMADTGSLSFLRTFTQSGTGTLFVDIDGDLDFDFFDVTQAVDIDGDINVDRGYTPGLGTEFVVMDGSSVTCRAGLDVTGDDAGGGNVFGTDCTSGNTVVLRVETP